MAYNQNGRGQQGQYGNAQGSPTPQNQYSTFVPQPVASNHHLRRIPSFDRGDDASYRHAPNGTQGGQPYGAVAYQGGDRTAMPSEVPLTSMQSSTLPRASYTSGSGGYQHQDLPPAPSTQPTYNPQQYVPPQTQYNPHFYVGRTNSVNAGYPPYVPAAYQTAAPQSSYGGQISRTYSNAMSPQQPFQAPPLPQRPYEHHYGNRVSPPMGSPPLTQYSSLAQETSYQQSPLPPAPNSTPLPSRSTYTPPAPPPPPFSPARDAFPSNPFSAAPQGYSHQPSISQTSQPRPSDRAPPTHNPLPPLPRYPSNGNSNMHSPTTNNPQTLPSNLGLNNSLPPTPGTPGPTPPQHSPQRTSTTGRHPQQRALPGRPSEQMDYFTSDTSRFNADDSQSDTEDSSGGPVYDELMREVEDAVMGRENSQRQVDEAQENNLFFAGDVNSGITPDQNYSHTNGHVDRLGSGQYYHVGEYSDRSDAEAEAGLAAMHLAEQQDAADERMRNSSAGSRPGSFSSHQNSRYGEHAAELSSDSDVHVDMDTYGGGFPGHVHYGDQPLAQPNSGANLSDRRYQARPSPGAISSQRSDISTDAFDSNRGLYDYPLPDQDDIHPFPPTLSARVDTGGTGGLAEPSPHPRRLSFEDGDEITLADSEGARTSATQSPSAEGMQDMFFHPGANSNRPLPSAPVGTLGRNRIPYLMPAGTYQHPDRSPQYDLYSRPSYPPAPDAYSALLTPSGTPVPRSSSLISHGSALQTVPPLRSKTDADRLRLLRQHQQMNARGTSVYGSECAPDSSVPQSAELLGLPEIPVGRRKKFNPSKLSTSDFKKCLEPWALSSIVNWIKDMSEFEADLKEQAIVDGIVALFTHKVPTMNTADAETLGARVVRSMFESGTLLKEEEWVKFGTEPMSGVLFQITGTGCYSPRVHSQALPGRCYAHHCMRTLKKINLQTQILEPQRKVEDWATFYKVPKSSIEAQAKKEVERQNVLHEIVTTEDTYMDQLNVLRILYRDELAKWQPPIITPKRKDSFLRDVFGKADAVKQVNEDFLLPQLKYRQQEQGPWILGFSDIFREWIRKARNAYVDYAASFPNATFLVRQESDRNILFRQFLDQVRDNERSKRLGWDTYLKAPITRLQRYTLLLSTIAKNTLQDDEEKQKLIAAIEEIKAVTLECDARVAEMSKIVDLSELASKLVLRPGMEKVQLNLTHLGREIIFKGDVQRAGSNKISWLEIHAILFDHYLVLSKRISQRDAAGGLKHEKYDVSKLPIPMDLLVLESTNDDPVKSGKLIGGITAITQKAALPQDGRSIRTSISNSNGTGGPGTLAHSNTATSTASANSTLSGKTLVPNTVLDGSKNEEKVMFPFRIRHLGKTDVYTLYAPSAQNRQDWCEKIIEAKTRHAASLFKQNAEPFRLRVIADTAFGYDAMSGGSKSIVIKGTPLDRAVREVEDVFDRAGPRAGPICRASVNCAVAFNQPYGNPMLAVGTDYGVFVSEYNNPRGWRRAITANRVTQIAVLEDFSLFLLISDKSLVAYHLDSVCPVSGNASPAPASDVSSRRAPQKLSGNRDVGFFATGRMKDRTLVFYKKREGISSTFKVLEPVYQKSSTSSRSRFGIRKGTTEFFRDFDDFYIPSETYAINLFHSSLAIATAKGFEVMTLDKKVPLTIPDLKPPDCASIAQRIRDLKPLGMFRLSDSEFLLVFEEVGIYVNKHGDVSRAVVMEFVGKAKQAVLYGGMYLVLVDQGGGFVEVRNAVNGRLRQVVSGKDVRLLDDGRAGGGGARGTVKICMQHPEWERCQVVLEMIVNEGLKE